MAQTEQVPLLTNVDESTLPPPPPYQPTESEEIKVEVEPVVKPVYETDKVIPLPTYDQSQKYEHDGVLEVEEDDEEVSQQPTAMVGQKLPGTCLDFTLFFMLVSFFGVVGFIFSICFAFTTAAESGALAGLGLTFVSNLLAFELHNKMDFYGKSCELYYSSTSHTKELCTKRLLYVTRLLFWFLGMFGLFLLIKGCQRYAVSRRQRMQVVIRTPTTDIE